jgi:hypothetical protein
MRVRGRRGLTIVLIGAGFLALGGAFTAYEELNPFAVGATDAKSRFAALMSSAYRPAASVLSKQLLLDTCQEAIAGLYGRLQAVKDREAVLVRCLEQADAIVAGAPSFSYAWHVGALAAAGLGDLEGFNARALQSQITGPAEQWVAELRAALVEDNFAAAGEEVRARHAADLRLLVASPRGIRSISRRYVIDPAFRERITNIVETMPEADQARFVAAIRSSAREGAS